MNITDIKALTGKALAEKAAELNVTGRSKMKADALRMEIASLLGVPWEVEAEQDSQVMPVDATDLVEVEFPRDGLDAQLIDTLEEQAAELPEWERQLIEEAQERIDTATEKQAEKPSKVMGLHFRGRAMGAKHHALIRAALDSGATRAMDQMAVYADPFMTRNDFRHTPNSERVQKYARQNDLAGAIHQMPVPKLTHRQMRRVRKNTRKHGEGFMYSQGSTGIAEREEGYSLLARTPEGLGIFYKFATV